ncbi:MAG: nucleotide sugar dehydrogenase [Acidobacteriota bacterium]|nr:nucleotide sugar dehydrogenase [Acidobacteriota bacterium]
MEILGIGAGYVGGPTMAMIADKCPEHRVTVVDINEEKIARWNSDNLPIYEPGLDELVQRVRGRNLFFSTDVDEGIRRADMIFVTVNTPTKSFGYGSGYASDLQYWELTARKIKENSDRPKIVIEKSTVPVRTAAAMERILHSESNGVNFEVLSSPEFMAEGTAVRDLNDPDRVLIGGRHDTETGRKAMDAVVDVFANWVPRERIICSNIWSAELSKLTANAFLAQRVSSINAISALCEKTEADVNEVALAIGMDDRIGSMFLKPSVGFGGSCFKKDLLSLVYLCESYGLTEQAEYWHQVVKMNEHQMERFAKRVINQMFNTLAGKRIVIMGCAFKADTGDTRESPGLTVARYLLDERADLVLSDPKALENARIDMADAPVRYIEDPYEAAQGAHALVVCTEWAQYRDLDFEAIYAAMNKPAFVFDGRNILKHEELFEIGFHVFPIGKKALTRFETS